MSLFKDDYFGKEEAEKYGSLIIEQLAGKTVSKRKDTAEFPGGLIYEANILQIDTWDLLKALEGMCHTKDALEIDDSTYKVRRKSLAETIVKAFLDSKEIVPVYVKRADGMIDPMQNVFLSTSLSRSEMSECMKKLVPEWNVMLRYGNYHANNASFKGYWVFSKGMNKEEVRR